MTLKLIKISAAVVIATAMLSSCAPRIVGTWNVQRYETVTPGQQSVSLSNIGTMKFKKNGEGEKKLEYSVLGVNRTDEMPFKWVQSDDSYIAIESPNSDFSKTWIILENKKKYQKWKSTDGSTNVQILELKK